MIDENKSNSVDHKVVVSGNLTVMATSTSQSKRHVIATGVAVSQKCQAKDRPPRMDLVAQSEGRAIVYSAVASHSTRSVLGSSAK